MAGNCNNNDDDDESKSTSVLFLIELDDKPKKKKKMLTSTVFLKIQVKFSTYRTGDGNINTLTRRRFNLTPQLNFSS